MSIEQDPRPQHTPVKPDEMPPLEPTAEVPAIHSDKLNDPEYWNDKFKATPTTPVQPEKPGFFESRRNRIGTALAGLVGIVGVGVVGYAATRGGSPSPDRKSDNPVATASATPGTPGETAAPVESPEAVIGQAGSTLENISVKPSPELVEEALQPVTVAEYPTPEAALEHLGQIENMILISGTVDTNNSEFPETIASLAEGESLWKNLLSSDGLENYDWQNNQRQLYAMELMYLNESGAVDTEGVPGTFHRDWIVKDVQEAGGGSYIATITKRSITNFDVLDPERIYQNFPDLEHEQQTEITVTFHNDDVRWYVDDMHAAS